MILQMLCEARDRADWSAIPARFRETLLAPVLDGDDKPLPLSNLARLTFEAFHGTRLPHPPEDPAVLARVRQWFDERGVYLYDLHPYMDDYPDRYIERRRERWFPPRDARPRGVNLIGFYNARSGQGEDLRQLGALLERLRIPVAYCVLPHPADGDIIVAPPAQAQEDVLPYSVSVYCLNALETALFRVRHGSLAFAGRYNIGLWPWELPRYPAQAAEEAARLDELWAISRFNLDGLRDLPVGKCHYLPPIVALPATSARSPADGAAPGRPFRFLYCFDARSYLTRKNPQAVVEAFLRAFPRGDETVQLVLKLSGVEAGAAALERLRYRARSDRRISLLEESLDSAQLAALFQSCDCYVSLHRSEGFGRTIAEAMAHGKAVIATDWSGSRDLVTAETGLPVPCTLVDVGAADYPGGEGQRWADADLDAAAQRMREVWRMPPQHRRALGERARQHVLEKHNADRAGTCYARRLEAIFSAIGAGS